jgi:hypothetical protein
MIQNPIGVYFNRTPTFQQGCSTGFINIQKGFQHEREKRERGRVPFFFPALLEAPRASHPGGCERSTGTPSLVASQPATAQRVPQCPRLPCRKNEEWSYQLD